MIYGGGVWSGGGRGPSTGSFPRFGWADVSDLEGKQKKTKGWFMWLDVCRAKEERIEEKKKKRKEKKTALEPLHRRRSPWGFHF